MHAFLQTIKDQGIPIQSACAAAQHLGTSDFGIGQLADKEYVKRINAIIGKTVKFENSDLARITYSYLVSEVINRLDTTDILDADDLIETATNKAHKLVTDHPYYFARSDVEEKLDADGNVKPKKGAKKEMAMTVYAEFIKDKITVRKEAIAILVEKVGMTPAGASTYYANLKKNDGVL